MLIIFSFRDKLVSRQLLIIPVHVCCYRMRDLSAHEKHEFQKLQKDLDLRKSEIAELARTKEKLSSRVEEMDNQISDLQEQVCSSGALLLRCC